MRLLAIVCLQLLLLPFAAAAQDDAVARGAYLVRAGGCTTCHTDSKNAGAPFAGGRALATPFGTYFSPNITADVATGIGGWSDDDFLAALKHGVRPDGSDYFPVFPYTTYTRMSDEDALAIKAYLFSLAPIEQRNRPHDVSPPFGWRWTMVAWKWLFFSPGDWMDKPGREAAWNRGGYLVTALAHCGECHTPRNVFGALDRDQFLGGTPDGPDGELVPNITSDPQTGIGDWSESDIVNLLREGLKPDFDNVQGSMAEAIRDGLGKLSDEDLQAIAVYLKTVPPLQRRIERSKP